MTHFIDLHIHTTASDGTDSPAEVVRKAADLGLAAVAITDHDTTSGLDEAIRTGNALGIEVIRGCELSVQASFGELHVLGLWLPEHAAVLEERLQDLRQDRTERNMRIMVNLHALGVPLDYEAVLAEAHGEVVGRPHIARALVGMGVVPDIHSAFERYLGSGAPAFSARHLIPAAEGVQLLSGLGATVAVAHPTLARCPRPVLEECIADLCRYGLDALEGYHAQFGQAEEQYVRALALRLGLGITGGSDYHGHVKPSIRIGVGKGALRIPEDVLQALKERRREKGLPV